jgi:hypothetical protein
MLTELVAAYKSNLKLLQHPDVTEAGREAFIGKDLTEKGVKDIQLIDKSVYETVEWIRKFVDVYGCLLSYIEPLKNERKPVLTADLVAELKAFMGPKKDELEAEYPNFVI